MNEIHAYKHQLNAVTQRLIFFYRLSFNLNSVFDEVERLKQMEEVLIPQARAEEKQCASH